MPYVTQYLRWLILAADTPVLWPEILQGYRSDRAIKINLSECNYSVFSFYVSGYIDATRRYMAPLLTQQKATLMLTFFRENLGLILGILIFSLVIFGGIYYVEHSLASQEQVVQ